MDTLMAFYHAQPEYIQNMLILCLVLAVLAFVGFNEHYRKRREAKRKCRAEGMVWDEAYAPKIYGMDLMKKFFKGLLYCFIGLIVFLFGMFLIGLAIS